MHDFNKFNIQWKINRLQTENHVLRTKEFSYIEYHYMICLGKLIAEKLWRIYFNFEYQIIQTVYIVLNIVHIIYIAFYSQNTE